MTYEPVHTLFTFYDGARTGIADYQGTPHFYDCEWDDLRDDYADTFWLTPVDASTVAMDLEASAIFDAWDAERRAGRVSDESHPGHGGRNARYDELRAALRPLLVTDPRRAARARGHFQRSTGGQRPPGASILDVRWEEVPPDTQRPQRVKEHLDDALRTLPEVNRIRVADCRMSPSPVAVDAKQVDGTEPPFDDPYVMWAALGNLPRQQDDLLVLRDLRVDRWIVATPVSDSLLLATGAGDALAVILARLGLLS